MRGCVKGGSLDVLPTLNQNFVALLFFCYSKQLSAATEARVTITTSVF